MNDTYVRYQQRLQRCGCYFALTPHETGKPCANMTHWLLLPRGLAICRTCAIYIATNNQAEHNAPILAPMLGTVAPERWM